MGRHTIAGQPSIEQPGKASRFVLVDEHNALAAAPCPRLAQFLGEDLERFVPAYARERAVAPYHRTAVSIRVVQSLQRRLTTRAERAAIHRMIRIALELDRAPVARLRNDSATDGAFTAC